MTFGAVAAPAEATTPLDRRTYTPQVGTGHNSQGEAVPTPPATTDQSSSARTTTTTAASVSHLHDHSGLTWDQLGKLFGVSRRAVHMWASGKRMNARNTELLTELLRLINSAPGSTAEERRAWLFAPRADGVTPIERFLDEHRRPGQPLSGSGYTPAGLLGITDE
jgi:DNA-binding transcriptional regulator YiaG